MSCPLVSVLMTAYNRERFIGEAIESVLSSTFSDFELIIVDDCSSDGTVNVARQYESDRRVRVYINDRNLGDYPNRNRAAAYGQGEYLKYVDSDDMIYPHGLSVMVDSMERFPAAGLGLCRLIAASRPYPFELSPEEAYTQHFLGSGFLSNAPLSAIIRRRAFQQIGGFSGTRFIGDGELWLKLAAYYPVVAMVPGLTWWRSHGDQEYVQGATSLAYAELGYRIHMQALTCSSCPLSHAAQLDAVERLKKKQVRAVLSLAFRLRRPSAAYTLFRMSGLHLGDLVRGLF